MEIYELDNIPEQMLGKVGGKAKGLYRLSRLGLNTGKGFVITDISSNEDLDKAVEYYINSGLGEVAVRSSASNEDGAEFSSAGQYKTFLNVIGAQEFKTAVTNCLKSLSEEQANAYSANFSQAKSSTMSVVIQQMVNAVKAGVAFSVNPIGKRDEILIEVVEGLGESLVSGEANSVQYVLSRKADEYLKQLNKTTEQLLTADELLEIAKSTLKAEKKLEMPLDTEFAIDQNGKVVWLQARAITTLDEVDINELDTKADVSKNLLTTCNIGEMLPGAATPLAITSTITSIDAGMRHMLESSHAYKMGKNRDLKKGDCIMSFYNTQFLNMNSVYKMAYSIMGASKDAIELSLCGRAIDYKLDEPKVCKLIKLKNGFFYFKYLLSTKKARKKLNKLLDRLEKSDSIAKRQCSDLMMQYENISELIPCLDEAFKYHFAMSAHSGAMSSALFQMVIGDKVKQAKKRLKASKKSGGKNINQNSEIQEEIDLIQGDHDSIKAQIAALLEGIDGIESVDILRSMRSVARAVLNVNPSAKDFDAAELELYLENPPIEVKSKLDNFLTRHGHRAIREIEVRSKSWNNDKKGLAEHLKTVISTGGEETNQPVDSQKNIDEFLSPYKGMFRKGLNYVIKQARQGVVNREFSKSKSIKVADYIKTKYIKLSNDMTANGLIHDSDLIYFLTHGEIKDVILGHSAPVKRAIARRRLFDLQQNMEFEDCCIGKPVPLSEKILDENATILKGMPISRGVITAKARVVKSYEDATKLQKGEIMVAVFTDIGWSPFYCLIGGLITEKGSALSHGAVVAREYSLPLISSVSNATRIIKTGDTIKLDAHTGTISIL